MKNTQREPCADCQTQLRAIAYRFGAAVTCGNCAVVRMKKGERCHDSPRYASDVIPGWDNFIDKLGEALVPR